MSRGPNYTVVPNDWQQLEYIISDLCSRILDEDKALSDYLLADGSRPLSANWDAGDFVITTKNYISDVATGTAPYACASTTVNTNLNADLLDGYHAASFGIISALTQGSVIFAGAGGALSQDNANFFWDNTNKRLGIGTASPQYELDIHKSGYSTGIHGRTDLHGVFFYGERCSGTLASPQA